MSGGGYTFEFDNKAFLVGTQSAKNSSSSFGVYISQGYFEAINTLLLPAQSGNVTEVEPTNLIVGSDTSGDNFTGSFRADIILGRDGADVLYGESASSTAWGNDKIYGGKGTDTLRGGRGFDLLHGGDDHAYGSTARVALVDDGIDTADYSDQTKLITIKIVPTAQGDQTFSTATDFSHAVFVETTADTYLVGTTQKTTYDTLISVEKIDGSDYKDVVYIKSLTAGPLANADGKGGLAEIDLRGETAAAGDTDPAGDLIDLHDMSAAVRANLTTGRVELKSNSNIGLKITNAERLTGGSKDDELIGNTSGNYIKGGDGKDTISGGASAGAIATTDITKYTDTLEGGAGDDNITGGGDYNILRGEAGNDTLTSAGRETHMYGGAGNDTLNVGSNAIIEDHLGNDTVHYGGIALYGGTKQWWMEGNKAYWAPFSTLLAAFPVIGSEILYTASFFIDVQTMKFATYMLGADGTLQMNLGWGHGGTAAITDYNLNLDTGIGSAGIAVFASGHGGTSTPDSGSMDRLQHFVNLALKAGFGHGIGGFDPVVLDLDGDGYELTTQGNSHTYFEFDSDGFGERTGWLRGGDDGFLVRDSNGNGNIDDVTEMFGNATTSGFAMLGAYDLNADGKIDASDAIFSELRVWQDANGNAVVDPGELKSLSELGIVSISLANSAPAEPTDAAGNAIVHTGHFTRADGTTGNLADVALDIDQTASRWLGDSTVSPEAAALPQLTGFGEIKDLRVAMTGDATLEAMVSSFVQQAGNDLPTLKASAEAILYEWAGVEGVAATAIGGDGFDARKLAFLEKYSGYQLMPRDVNGAPLTANLAEMESLWADQVTRLTLRLVVQGPMADEFAGISYRADLDLLVADTPTALKDLYHRLLADLPSDPAAALAEWQGWAPLLGAMAEGMRRSDANLVRGDYVAAQLLAGMDGVAQPLSYSQLAGALGIDNLRLGTAGNDALTRGSASDTAVYVLQGGGTDSVTGGSGQDVYVFGRDIGHATITDVEAKPAGDRIRFAFLTPSDVSMVRDGHDLLITVTATGETVRVVGQFADVVPLSSDVLLSPDRGVEDIQFADGAIWETPEIMTAVGTGTDGNDHMIGTMHSDVLIGGKGDDLLEGGDDADLYVINAGDGHDIIHDQQSTVLLRAADLLIFGNAIAPTDLAFARAGDGGDDLVVTIGAAGQTVTIEGEFGYTSLGYNDKFAPNTRIESFGFQDYGDSYGIRDVEQRMIGEATTAGNDTTRGFGDDDEFFASAGNDTLIGMDGVDGYHWGAGAGNDVIDEQARYIDIKVGLGGLSLVDGADTILFDGGIVRSDLVFSRATSAPDLTITLLSTGETLTIHDQFDGFQTGPLGPQWLDRVEWFQFSDGSRLSWQDVLGDVTKGGTGNDSLWGDLYADTMDGGAGDDLLSGGGLGDTYVFKLGYGHDTLVDNNQFILGSGFVTVDTTPDVLRFGPGIAPADVHFVRSGADLILNVGTGGDSVTLKGQDDYFHTGVFGAISYNRIEQVRFDDGTVWTWQDLNRLALADVTTPGNDVAQGFMMSDRFEASAGDDVMIGGDSSDTYVFGHGSGHDTIRESVSNPLYGDYDILEFSPDVTAPQVSIARSGEDLILTLAGSGDTMKIEGEFHYEDWFQWWDINEFRFADGTVWTKQDIQVRLLQATPGADHLVGFMTGDTLDGGAGNDILEGGDGGDTYVFGRGSGSDVIRETVTNANLGDNDRLVFTAGVLPSDVTWTRDGDDLVITILNSPDTLRIEGQFAFSNWFAWSDVESFQFADGTVLSDRDVAAKIMGGTPGDDHIVGTFRSDVLDGGAGNDILEGGDGADRYVFGRGYGQDEIRESLSNANLSEDDELQFLPGVSQSDLGFQRVGNDLVVTILGTTDKVTIKGEFDFSSWFTWWDIDRFSFADGSVLTKDQVQQKLLVSTPGADHLVGFMTPDVLDGGAGDDILEGADGADTYVFGRGYGHDIIRESVSTANLSEDDRLSFGSGITLSDLNFTQQGNNLVISILGTSDSVTIEGEFDYSNWFTWEDVDHFDFADGSSLTRQDVQQILLRGTSGNDHLVGYLDGDTLDGGAGNDILEGGDGGDTYVFGRGYGQDEIRETLGNANLSEFDTVRFGPGIAWSDLRFAISGNDLTIAIAGTSDTLTIKREFETINDVSSQTWNDVENFTFTDGSTKSSTDIMAQAVQAQATAGDDHIVGFYVNDTIVGGPGNDLMEGGRGADTYVHNIGDGNDVVSDYVYVWGSGGDRVLFGPGIAPADVTVRRSTAQPADIILSVLGGQSSVTLTNQFSGGGEWTIDTVEFANGTVWTKEQLANFIVTGSATSGNDIIDGTSFSEEIHGGAGDDLIRGNGGNDRLDGGAGNDRIEGSYGNEIYMYGLGGGDDVIWQAGWWGAFDIVEFGLGLNAADMIVRRSGGGTGGDMILTFAGIEGSLTVQQQYSTSDGAIDEFHFADGTVLSADALNVRYLASISTSGPDTIVGSYMNDNINAGGGDDLIYSGGGNDRLDGGPGNDRLEGSGGNDVYVYALGGGNDIVTQTGWWGAFDVIELGAGLDPANLVVTRSGGGTGGDMILSFAGIAGSITIAQQFGSPDNAIDEVHFANGTVLNADALNARYLAGVSTSGADTIYGSYMNDTINGGGGDDFIYGSGGNDRLDGGPGNDRLEGSYGNDVYVYSLGGGNDIVWQAGWYGAFDYVDFGAGLNPADLIVSRSAGGTGGDMILTFAGIAGSLTVQQQFSTSDGAVDEVRFADGTVMSAAVLNARYLASISTAGADTINGSYMDDTINAGAGDDFIYGNGGNDRLDGGPGNDRLQGANGNDVYVYGSGGGNDIITQTSWWGAFDVLELGAGITPASVAFKANAADLGDLIMTFADGGSVLIDDQLNSDRGVDEVHFADGTVWDAARLRVEYAARQGTSAADVIGGTSNAETLNGYGGDDTITAFEGNDTIIGGAGNDRLEGGDGTDTYIYNVGDGDDVIFDQTGSRDNKILFGAGIAQGDLVLSRTIEDPTDLRITFKTISGSITIDHETWPDAGVEILQFADGSTLSGAALAAKIGPGTSGADSILGTAAADEIFALEGADTVTGLAGDDSLHGDAGNDILAGGAGNDALSGGAGDDLLLGDSDYGANLLANGSFDVTPSSYSGFSWGIAASAIPGWTKTNASPYELVNSGFSNVVTADGGRWLDLDGQGSDPNMQFSQAVAGRAAGESLELRFDAANYTTATSGSFDVLWNGAVVASFVPTGTTMHAYTLTVTAIAGSNVLGFRGTGTADGLGAALDNVRLYSLASGPAGDDQITGGTGNDTAKGGSGNDLYYFNRGDGSDQITELPGEGTDKLVFGSGIDSAELRFATAANGRDVVLTFTGGGESITFVDGATNPAIGIEEFRFADGTVWDQPTIESHIARYTSGPDVITGTAGNDTLRGGGGDDTLSGAAGNDLLTGDDGNDTLDGGLGNDTLDGVEGDDRLVFSPGNDDYRGGNGVDTLDLSAAGSAATVDLSAASNQLAVGGVSSQVSGVETVLGSAFNDSLTGDSGANRLDGGAGVDTIVGGGGDDTLIGGLGDDVFQYSGAANGFDSVDGGAGTDTIQAMAAGTTIGLSTLTGVETISAGALANVTIAGSANADTFDFTAVTLTGIARIDGGAGNDTITGSTGNDEIAGGAGDDTLAGGAGNDIFDYSGAGEGSDAVDGGTGTNTIRAMAASTYIGLRSLTNIQTITANGFADVHLTGTAGADVMNYAAITLTGIAKIEGLAGDDTITGTALADTIDGGDGNDTITGGAGDDTLTGGLGNDTFKLAGAADGFDAIDGGAGTDTIQATAANAVLSFRSVAGVETVTANGLTGVSIAGSSGNDSLDFSLSTLVGITKIDAGAGNDVVLGSAAAETLIGGAGDDLLNGGGGNDTFQVTGTASGFDAVDGGVGTDTIQAMAASTMIGLTSIAGIETITAGTFTGVYISGSANADTLDFTAVTTMTGIGRIDGGAGNDTITGSGLADIIVGGTGDDTLAGGAGNDTFQVSGTTAGFDAVDGGAGTDTISATAASTVIGLRSLTGVETVSGGSFSGVYIQGSGGDDVLNFLAVTLTAITKVDGGAGNDTITGNSAANTLFGGIGNDVLNGDAGIDTLNGDDGDDTIAGGLGNDTINGGNGLDTVDYSYSTTAWTVNLAATSSQGVSSKETDTISNVENVTGSGLADTITGTAAVNVLKGGAGNDRITGGGGNDSIDGGAGTDVAVFAGLKASYSVVTSGGTIQIVDTQPATDGDDGTDTLVAVETAEFKGGVQLTLAPPIVLDLDGDGVNLIDRFASAARFDWNGDGLADQTGWMGRGDGMLVFDRDHDGTVSGAGELSFIDDKPGAKSDLDGLSAFDSNHDGLFSALDAAWADFRVWRDSDGNGEVGPGEFLTMEAAGVAAISLSGTATERSWGMADNILVNEGIFLRTDGSGGALADVALNYFAATPSFRHLMADAVRAEQDYAHRAGESHSALAAFAGASDQPAADGLPPAFALPVFHSADDAALRPAADPAGLA
jgi:Ca2+-binding RTX toxin-like protein